MHITQCAVEFEKATNCRLDDLFVNAEEELPEFFRLKSDIFSISKNGDLSLVDPSSHYSMSMSQKPVRSQKPVGGGQSSKDEIIILD